MYDVQTPKLWWTTIQLILFTTDRRHKAHLANMLHFKNSVNTLYMYGFTSNGHFHTIGCIIHRNGWCNWQVVGLVERRRAQDALYTIQCTSFHSTIFHCSSLNTHFKNTTSRQIMRLAPVFMLDSILSVQSYYQSGQIMHLLV